MTNDFRRTKKIKNINFIDENNNNKFYENKKKNFNKSNDNNNNESEHNIENDERCLRQLILSYRDIMLRIYTFLYLNHYIIYQRTQL